MKPITHGTHQKKLAKTGEPCNCHRAIKHFESSIKGNLRFFQNHRKQGKINIVFCHFLLLGINEPP